MKPAPNESPKNITVHFILKNPPFTFLPRIRDGQPQTREASTLFYVRFFFAYHHYLTKMGELHEWKTFHLLGSDVSSLGESLLSNSSGKRLLLFRHQETVLNWHKKPHDLCNALTASCLHGSWGHILLFLKKHSTGGIPYSVRQESLPDTTRSKRRSVRAA